LAEGQIRDLKQLHDQCYEVRLKAEIAPYAQRLTALGFSTELADDLLRVRLPAGRTAQDLWQVAAEQGQQIRYLRPQRSTLEEVFLKAVERP
jgi:ABC-2 type transport system ATP-binding protein